MESGQEVRLELQRFVREAQNILSVPSDEAAVTDMLQMLIYLSGSQPDTPPPHSPYLTSVAPDLMSRVRQEFTQHHYSRVCNFLLAKLTVDWVSVLPSGSKAVSMVTEIFLQGPPHLSFMVLAESLTSCSPGYSLKKTTDILEELITSRLEYLFWYQCQISPSHPDTQLWPNIISLLATLPDRVTARLHTQASAVFYPAAYIAQLCTAMYSCLTLVRENLQLGNSCSVQFLAQLLGKLAMTGYKDEIWEQLLPPIECHLASDAIWCRVCERLVSNVPDRCLEATIVPLVEKASWYGTVYRFLGDSILHNNKLRFLLTNKLLLLRYYHKHKIVQNILGYLSHSPTTRHLLVKILHSVLDVWGDGSALRHTSYQQHLYVCKAIVISLAFIDDNDRERLKSELLPKLMSGMQCHLESAIPSVRHVGMAVAECVTSTLDPGGEKLGFQYEGDEDTVLLKELLVKPQDPGPLKPMPSKIREPDNKVTSASRQKPAPDQEKSGHHGNSDDELDSDDDLEPYDMSDDVKTSKMKTPVYLRDCMEGLLSSEEPERLEVCVNAAEGLVYRHSTSVIEISVEFTKILLHLQDNYSLPGFLLARHRALVALAYTSPKQVAEYLTTQFYERNYNIRQRIDMLEVLSSAAQKLSDPIYTPLSSDRSKSSDRSLIQEITTTAAGDPPGLDEPGTWRDIVDRRIEAKTRRFSRASHVTTPTQTANRFAPVAGFFFFPLLDVFHRREGMMDILGSDDHLLLTRLIYTLGVIMYSAIHAPLVRQMVRTLMEFVWSLRYHPQPAVRQALLFTLSMMLLAVPSHILFTDLQQQMVDTKIWLQDVIEKDTNSQCKELAVQAMMLLSQALNKEFRQDNG